MKTRVILAFIALLFVKVAYAQEERDTFSVENVEVKPQFPGGEDAIRKFIVDKFEYPKEIENKWVQGQLIVQYLVNSKGKVSNVKIEKGVEPYIDAEMVRVVKKLPNWTPGINDGVNVAVYMKQTFDFEIGESDSSSEKKEVCDTFSFSKVEVKPVFPGGDVALMKFISGNCEYPEYARRKRIQGRVFVQFVITSEGKVINTRIAKGVEAHLDAEAVRVVSLLPDWTPGMQDGENVDVTFVVPINFKLYGGSSSSKSHPSKEFSSSGSSNGGGLFGLWKLKREEKKANKEKKNDE